MQHLEKAMKNNWNRKCSDRSTAAGLWNRTPAQQECEAE